MSHSLKLFTAALGFAAVIATTAPASATLIDFETFPGGGAIPNGTFITNQFASVGVSSFSTTDPAGTRILRIDLAGRSGLNTLAGNGGSFDFNQPINIQFSVAVTSASVVALDVGERGVILEAFDAANTLLDSDSFVGTGNGLGTFVTLSVAAAGIDRLVISQVTRSPRQ